MTSIQRAPSDRQRCALSARMARQGFISTVFMTAIAAAVVINIMICPPARLDHTITNRKRRAANWHIWHKPRAIVLSAKAPSLVGVIVLIPRPVRWH